MKALGLLIAALLLAGCSSPTAPAGPPITVTGSPSTGVSPRFNLAGGSYSVDWQATSTASGCLAYIYLSTAVGGDVVEDTGIQLSAVYSGTREWTNVPAGSYVLQEDWTGLLNCKGPWSATITPE